MAPAQQSSDAVPIGKWTEEQFSLPFVIESREQLELAAGEIALKQLELERLARQQEEEVASVQARYAQRLGELGKVIAERTDAAYAWCLKHEAAEFGSVRTLSFPLASVSFNVNPPAVEVLEGWSEKSVVVALRKWFLGRRYLRISFSIDKQAVKKDWDLRPPFVWARRGIAVKRGRTLKVEASAKGIETARLLAKGEVKNGEFFAEYQGLERVEPS